jgi:hypothetical protein
MWSKFKSAIGIKSKIETSLYGQFDTVPLYGDFLKKYIYLF